MAIAAAHSDWSVPALWVFVVSYVVFAATTATRPWPEPHLADRLTM